MFIITSLYKKPTEDVDKFLVPHRAFLDKYIQQGVIIGAGRKVPRVGGVILAKGKTRAEIETIMKEDPFAYEGIAEYEIVEVELARFAPGYEILG
jgi:uncharacterized protein YciI